MSNDKTKESKLQIIINAINNNKLSIELKKQKIENHFNNQQTMKEDSLLDTDILKKIYTDVYLAELLNCNNMLKEHDLYLERCKKYLEYLSDREKSPLLEIKSRYALLDLIQKESMNKFQNEYNFKNQLIDIDDDCLSALNICKGKKIDVPEGILRHIISRDNKMAIMESIKKSVSKEIEYKKTFIEESFNITDSVIEQDLFFDYNIETVVDSLYNKKEIKDEVHTK